MRRLPREFGAYETSAARGAARSTRGVSLPTTMSQSQHAGKKSPDQTTDDRYAEWTDLRKFERDCLVAIAVHNEDTPYGLAIKAELETWYREELNHGRLYPNLNDLVRRGLVSKSEIDKRTNGYALTDRGREVLQAGAGRLRDAVGGAST